MDKMYVIEEVCNRSGNYRLFRGTLESLKKYYNLNETIAIPYKWDFVYISEPTTIKGLVRALNRRAKYGVQYAGLSYSLVKA